MVALNFNATAVKPNVALEAVPSGQYPVIITKSEEKPTKAGTGSYIEFEMTIQGGEYNGRKLFDRLNIKNANQQAVDIAYSTLSAICHVTGRLNMTDTQQLHGVPFIAVAVKKERDDQPGSGNYTNEVKGYKDINGNDPGAAGHVANPAAQPNWAAQQPGQPIQQQQAPVQQFQPQPVQQAGAPNWAQQAQAQTPVQQPMQQPQFQQQPGQMQQPAQQQVAQPTGPAGAGAPPPWVQGQPAA